MKYQPGKERNGTWLAMKLILTSNEMSAWQGKKWERHRTWLAKKYQLG
jgi:hypothetical protein